MYQERMFETWKEGLIYLVIVMVIPLLPAIIYLMSEPLSDSYLYVLLLTIIISFANEFIKMPGGSKCSIFLIIENIISCSVLAIMFVWTMFLLTYTSGTSGIVDVGIAPYILVSMFGVPVLITLLEIIRCIIAEVSSRKPLPDKNNLKGASSI